MNISFFTNYFNHHQKSFSDELEKKTRKYTFVSTGRMGSHRKALGYEISAPSYVTDISQSVSADEVLKNITDSTDVFIGGSAPEKILQQCIKTGRPFFRFCERPLKKSPSMAGFVKTGVKERVKNPMSKPIYMLCAGGYVAADYSRFSLFKDRTYKWGYFPETKIYDTEKLMGEKNSSEILWCGRFIDWKHPEAALQLAYRLKNEGYNFTLRLIGTGPLEQQLKKMAAEMELEDRVHFTGPVKPAQVREYMEKAGIFIFTSDRNEGWGAVLNEAMNSGCSVVASHMIGAVPFLVEDGMNGYVYRDGNREMLAEKVKYLLNNIDEQKRAGKAALKTITEEWNGQVAAERFLNLAQHILDGEKYPDLYERGPCSKAAVIKEEYIRK